MPMSNVQVDRMTKEKSSNSHPAVSAFVGDRRLIATEPIAIDSRDDTAIAAAIAKAASANNSAAPARRDCRGVLNTVNRP